MTPVETAPEAVVRDASLRAFFEPRVVAVIGANRRRGKIGAEIFNNLISTDFTATVIPVHPTAAQIAGVKAYPRVVDIPHRVDLAIVVVPAEHVLAAVDDVRRRGDDRRAARRQTAARLSRIPAGGRGRPAGRIAPCV